MPLDAGAAAFARGRVERRGAHGDHLDGIAGLHRGERVAGIDVALEGIGPEHLDDVGQLGDVQQRGEARHDVLAVRGRGGEDRAVAGRQRLQQQHEIFGDRRRVGGVLDLQHAGDARHLGRGRGRRAAVLPGDQDVDRIVQRPRRRDRGQGRLGQPAVLVLRQDQDAHQITLASWRSLSTSSATLATRTPDWRRGGSSTFRIWWRGAMSTPSCSGVSTSIGFFLAFMMLGRLA